MVNKKYASMDELEEAAQPLWAAFFQDPTDLNRQAVFDHYKGWATATIKKRWRPGVYAHAVELDDAISIGLHALWNVIPKFDPTRSKAFGCLAHMAIWGRVLDSFRKYGNMKKQADGSFFVLPQTISLDRKVGGDRLKGEYGIKQEDTLHGDPTPPWGDAQREDLRAALLRILNPQTRYVLEQIFFYDRTSASLGRELGIGETMISHIKMQGLERLRRFFRDRKDEFVIPKRKLNYA